MSDPVLQFEHKCAKLIGSDYVIAVNSGTSALHAALEACDVRGGEVIMPALCPGLVAFPIIHAGATPVFADVDPQTHLVTHDTIQRVITPRTKAVIAVALHGLPTDMDRIIQLCRPLKIRVIEDCAQCLLGRYKDGFAGTKADFGCFSFERKKHITTGSEGGAIVTNNQELAVQARKFAGLGYKHLGPAGGSTSLDARDYQHPDYKRFDTIGLNYRMSWATAEIGISALRSAQDKVWIRQEIGYLWQNALNCQLQPHDYDAENTFYTAAYDPGYSHVNLDRGVWRDFYDEFVKLGGDGFYAAPALPFFEPALSKYYPGSKNHNAWKLQRNLMLFKTHYPTVAEAKKQCDILAGMVARAA